MFFNEMTELETKGDVYDPGHKAIQYSDGVNYTLIFLIYAPILLFFNYIELFMSRFGKWIKLFK